jgi:hemerythrin-like domain-containing protein
MAPALKHPEPAMTPHALTLIRHEHQALSAILHALRRSVEDIGQRGTPPRFEALRALLFYIDAFPERLHHPKESEHLFRCLRQRCPQAAPVLDRLDHDHQRGHTAIRELEYQLLEYEMLGASRLPAFAAAVQTFCDRHAEHMHTEEHEVFPLAQRSLLPEDWAAITAAFEANRDPLTGHPPAQEFEALFSRIVHLLPAPLGLGPAGD